MGLISGLPGEMIFDPAPSLRFGLKIRFYDVTGPPLTLVLSPEVEGHLQHRWMVGVDT